jgi:enolase-phosphatase E1
MIKLYLFDIEGTTTDINFVHQVLFPYSSERMENFILSHQLNEAVVKALDSVRETVKSEEKKSLSIHEIITQLIRWIKEDRKHPALKEIQGLIWDNGYCKGDFKGHVYQDVKPFFQKIVSAGLKVGIYSSGSVHAQKLIFGYSVAGDLTPFISYYFDTKVGGKRATESYKKIAEECGFLPPEIHFFSDIPQELEAANAAGLSVTQVLRDGCQSGQFDCIKDFKSLIDRI